MTPSRSPVVVNRMRDSLGWSRRDIVGMVEGYVRPAGVHFLPEDRAAADRALVAGRSLVELGDSAAGPRRHGGPRGGLHDPRQFSEAAHQQVEARDRVATITASMPSCPVTWCRWGSSAIARSWATTTPTT